MKNLQRLVLNSSDGLRTKYALQTYSIPRTEKGGRTRIHCDVVLVSSGKIVADFEASIPRINLIVNVCSKLGLV